MWGCCPPPSGLDIASVRQGAREALVPIWRTGRRSRCHLWTIQLDRIDEASLGELLMHFMLETIVAA